MEEKKWAEGVPLGLGQKLTNMVLVSLSPSSVCNGIYRHLSFLQARAPDGQLIVNFDPVLHEAVTEAYHLSRPPLSMRIPPVIKSLIKTMDKEELRDRRASLELVMQVYRDIQRGMSKEERLLLHSKLEQVEAVSACITSAQ